MPSSLSMPPISSSLTAVTPQIWLIPIAHRLRFATKFVLATGLGWLLTSLVLRGLQTPLLNTTTEPENLLGTFVAALIGGIIISGMQWWVLRRHLPDWLWIGVSSVGYVLLILTQDAWWAFLERSFSGNPALTNLSPLSQSLLAGGLNAVLASICAGWLGLAQWLLIRRYALSSSFWLLLPSIATFTATLLLAISRASVDYLGVPFAVDAGVLGAGLLGLCQAIGVCWLRKRHRHPITSGNLLARAPEITGRSQVHQIVGRVQNQLHATWKKRELVSDQPIRYWVGADDTGSIVAYQAVDAIAQQHSDLTPLPTLVDATYAHKPVRPEEPLARVLITWLPSGKLQLQPLLGTPLTWIGGSLLVGILVLSAAIGYWQSLPH